MAATSIYIASTTTVSSPEWTQRHRSRKVATAIRAQQQTEVQQKEANVQKGEESKQANVVEKQPAPPRTQEAQPMARSKNLDREYGGQWLSSCTRHVRIYAAYIDPVTYAFDQTQMDKLTLILDPTNEFVWTNETCNKVYAYFQELVDHYEGAPLTEYTLRLIGSDIEHYIRKLLYDGEIKYNMNAKVLNFSMGKPRVLFNSNQLPRAE
ncbi:NAD(P)H-quinone oxidoreductase subunit M, chloroplastic [Aristolochia californica]|uniref:NAD(P)H-quinone oxidoreductase subunit M, chloroplastic n=1 Tax=Aristolochia californica TaxID=171875 RepID=UPI0035D5860F